MRLYDTLSRTVVDVTPAGDELTMYSCGPTVYREAHIGNLRTYLTADLVARGFRYLGTPVRQVQNITDVGHMTDEIFGEGGEDRMQIAVEDSGLTAAEIAERYTQLFLSDIDAFGIQRADAYPRASEHVPQMIELISKLIENQHAYEIDGNVYYDTQSFHGYGRLSRNTLDSLESDHRRIIGDTNKKHPSDFVLWMSAGANRVMVFDSPWGTGYPGWHIECSAMSIDAFGDAIDLHTGGEDNVFPHHEDEIAQSEGALGKQVVRYWLHGAHLLAEGHKMSKSAKNDYSLRDLAARGHKDPRALRLLFLQARYRSQITFSFEALTSAERALRRWRDAAASWRDDELIPIQLRRDDAEQMPSELDQRFVGALTADLDTPTMVKLLSEVVSSRALSPGQKWAAFSQWDDVLGLGLCDENERFEAPKAVHEWAALRQAARGRGDYDAADDLRQQISAAGFEVRDTSDGYALKPKR